MARLRWLTLWLGLVLAWFAGVGGLVGSAVAPSAWGRATATVGVDHGDTEHAAWVGAAEAEAEAFDPEAEPAPLPLRRTHAGVASLTHRVLRRLVLPGAIAPRDGPATVVCCVASRRWAPEGAQGPPRRV